MRGGGKYGSDVAAPTELVDESAVTGGSKQFRRTQIFSGAGGRAGMEIICEPSARCGKDGVSATEAGGDGGGRGFASIPWSVWRCGLRE